MQNTDSTIMPTQKRSLTDSQEKFLDALFGEARGNPKKAGELAGAKMVDMLDEDGTTPHANIRMEAAKQILDRIGIAKKEKIDINMQAVHGLFILPAKDKIKRAEPLHEDKKTI